MGAVIRITSLLFKNIENFNTELGQIQVKCDGDDVVFVTFA